MQNQPYSYIAGVNVVLWNNLVTLLKFHMHLPLTQNLTSVNFFSRELADMPHDISPCSYCSTICNGK